jgi:hypothetical protein
MIRVEGMTAKEAKQALLIVKENASVFLTQWEDIHG